MATQDLSERQPIQAVDRSQGGARGGSIGMVLLVAIALVGAAVGLLLVGRGNAGPYILGLLALLAMVGVFSLFALATGILRVARQGRRQSDAAGGGRRGRRRPAGDRPARPRDLCQRQPIWR